ncbi:hypothetical protein [Rufibacter sp. LB8]|uniref:hypothetical protein n=1 Tax=Rufibacter sp. LB8 TaxID=2777781 RepID=UPI00178C3106|nr:hypothetical protein [Rufibacter sp. LB8]
MKKLLLLLCYLFIFSACEQNQPPKLVLKACSYQTSNAKLQLYNDVLIELVERHFYHRYLGESFADSIITASNVYELTDSMQVFKELNKMSAIYSQRQKEIFNNPEQWCTVYLDTAWYGDSHFEEILRALPIDSAEYLMGKRLGFQESEWKPSYLINLQSPQKEFKSKNFQACTFRVADIQHYQIDRSTCEIGRFQFSNVSLNGSQTKGWLYYEFSCGGNCGMGEILTIEKSKDKWVIKSAKNLWIS